MNKIQLRSELRRRRREIPNADRIAFAQKLVRHVLHSGLLLRYRRIGIYLSHGTEINTLNLMNKMLSLHKQVYLPMLPYGRGKKLWFNRVETGLPWVLNRFGMTENRSRRPLRTLKLDLLFMPLLGYDDIGYRIGTGGGYYDASLDYLCRRKYWRVPYLIGVSFACQHLEDRLLLDSWDVPMNAILTERGLHRFHPDIASRD